MEARFNFVYSLIIKLTIAVVLSFALWIVWLTQVNDRGLLNREWPAVSDRLNYAFYQIMKDMDVTRIVARSNKGKNGYIFIYKDGFFWDHKIKYPLSAKEDFVLNINKGKITFIPVRDVIPVQYTRYKKRIYSIIETVIEREIDYIVDNMSAEK